MVNIKFILFNYRYKNLQKYCDMDFTMFEKTKHY